MSGLCLFVCPLLISRINHLIDFTLGRCIVGTQGRAIWTHDTFDINKPYINKPTANWSAPCLSAAESVWYKHCHITVGWGFWALTGWEGQRHIPQSVKLPGIEKRVHTGEKHKGKSNKTNLDTFEWQQNQLTEGYKPLLWYNLSLVW